MPSLTPDKRLLEGLSAQANLELLLADELPVHHELIRLAETLAAEHGYEHAGPVTDINPDTIPWIEDEGQAGAGMRVFFGLVTYAETPADPETSEKITELWMLVSAPNPLNSRNSMSESAPMIRFNGLAVFEINFAQQLVRGVSDMREQPTGNYYQAISAHSHTYTDIKETLDLVKRNAPSRI